MLGADVQRERGVGLGIGLEQPVRDHQTGATIALLAGLEHEFDGARQLVTMPVQQVHRLDQHRRMCIVAAGMHAAGYLAGVVEPGILRHRQGVHVAAQQDRAAGLKSGFGAAQ